jgi:hypothetical protein
MISGGEKGGQPDAWHRRAGPGPGERASTVQLVLALAHGLFGAVLVVSSLHVAPSPTHRAPRSACSTSRDHQRQTTSSCLW